MKIVKQLYNQWRQKEDADISGGKIKNAKGSDFILS